MARENWSREELIVAFNLYCKIPFGKIDKSNPEIIALANAIGRSPSAVSWKLANFARLDPSLKERGIAGATHGAAGDVEVWEEFSHDWERLSFESERLLAEQIGTSIEEFASIEESELPREGKEREAIVRIRINQNFFRRAVLAAYDNRCCITGLAIPELLNASHIVPWALDKLNGVNPRNGLCLNVLHDRAFDRGLLTITPQFKVSVSTSLKLLSSDDATKEFLLRFDGVSIRLPTRFVPEVPLLEFHNSEIFKN